MLYLRQYELRNTCSSNHFQLPIRILSSIFMFMKVATYNINGISARQPVLLQWLEELKPDVACLQKLKAPQERFPCSS